MDTPAPYCLEIPLAGRAAPEVPRTQYLLPWEANAGLGLCREASGRPDRASGWEGQAGVTAAAVMSAAVDARAPPLDLAAQLRSYTPMYSPASASCASPACLVPETPQLALPQLGPPCSLGSLAPASAGAGIALPLLPLPSSASPPASPHKPRPRVFKRNAW